MNSRGDKFLLTLKRGFIIVGELIIFVLRGSFAVIEAIAQIFFGERKKFLCLLREHGIFLRNNLLQAGVDRLNISYSRDHFGIQVVMFVEVFKNVDFSLIVVRNTFANHITEN